ncbi:PHP domain-containing protein [Sunxiuqinia sp. A32]|uniref:PHP domain-containing protein n=1 Tax=Sunxiuqinia sp. A32 TaxID=3461496 RepID=UPI0040468016
MKKFRADLHIHTVLSPCADLEMSPDQIISRALEMELNIIAITDHNSTKQCAIVKKMAEGTDLFVINGCEVNSSEEIHAICLFEDDYTRNKFQLFLDKHLPHVPNHRTYYNQQVVVDEENRIVEEIENYLATTLDVGIEVIEKTVHELNGLFIPAHIDRPINSIYSQLGFIPIDLQIDALQITKQANEKYTRVKYDIHEEVSLIKASDAHYIEDFGSGYSTFSINELTFQEIKWALLQKNGRSVNIDS